MQEQIEKWRLQMEKWLDLQEAADLLQETKSEVFAQITSEMDGTTNAEKERQARLSERWNEFNNNRIEANSKARRAKAGVKYCDMKFTAANSAAANARAERRNY